MKNNSIKRTLAVVLALTMVLAVLTGCKKKTEEENTGPEFVYVSNYITLPDEITEMNNSYVVGDTIFFSSNTPVYPDGTVVPRDVLDKYYEDMNAYYEKLNAVSAESGTVRYATSSSSTNISATEAPVAEGEESPAAEEPLEDPIDTVPVEEPPFLEFTYEYRLYSVKIDGTELKYLDAYKPMKPEDSMNSYSGINKFMVDNDGNLWVMEYVNVYQYDLPEDFDETTGNMWDYFVGEENTYYARKLDQTGAVIQEYRLNDYIENIENLDYFYLNNLQVDGDGNMFFDDGNGKLYVVRADGTLAAKLTFEGWIQGYTTLKDGRVAVSINNYNESTRESKTVLKTVDLATGDWGESFDLTVDAYNMMPGGETYDFCYNSGSSLFGYNLATATETKIITWINNDIDGNYLQYCSVKDNGDVFVITNNYSEATTNFEIANLVKTPASEVTLKETITLATFYLDYELRNKILEFNKTNPDYRIEVSDYSEYNTQDDYTAGVTKLNTEIISGKIPDIISTYQLPYLQYAAKGLLEDLYKYIDSDAEISRDDLVESIFKSMEEDGKLYTIASNFGVISIVGNSSVLGSGTGWTMTEFQNVLESHPEADYPLGMNMTREDVFSSFCALNLESYVDWMTGKCSFDSEDFKSLLEFTNTFPSREDMDYENMEWISEDVLIAEGRMIASFFGLYDFNNFQYYKAMYGGDIVFKGMPNEDGGGNAAIIQSGLAMTTSCKNKDAAWSFMRIMLTEEYQKNIWGIPTNKNMFDEKLAEAMKQEYDSEGNPISKGGYWMEGQGSVDYYALTQEEADQIMLILNSVTHTSNYDTSLVEIIEEEASAYFAGEKSVDEVASLIQSRMSIYINEQR